MVDAARPPSPGAPIEPSQPAPSGQAAPAGAGAWCGVGVAFYAALTLAVYAVALAFGLQGRGFLDLLAADVSLQMDAARVGGLEAAALEVTTEGWELIAGPLVVWAGSGIVVSLILLVLAVFVVAGRENGRRIARGAVFLAMTRVSGLALWTGLVLGEKATQWAERAGQVIDDFHQAAGAGALEVDLPGIVTALTSGVGTATMAFVHLALLTLLYSTLGRPSVERWCALRTFGFTTVGASAVA